MTGRRILLAGFAGLAVAALLVASHATTYWQTREKWYALGKLNGAVDGRAEAMALFAPFARIGGPPRAPDAMLAVKAQALSAIASGEPGEVTLYFQP